MFRRALVPALLVLAAAVAPAVAANAPANPGPLPLPLPVADTVVNEGVSVEGPLVNNIGLPTVV
ncbi:hypothetical protein [Streptomyces atriruber]|uniref:hypothetical protein n=1 Tax=Streptomyces atriruber TaxID=545121 RepID=UPI0006E1CE43|nr:hypothetical protein [Streptomyces atriruber]